MEAVHRLPKGEAWKDWYRLGRKYLGDLNILHKGEGGRVESSNNTLDVIPFHWSNLKE